VSRFRKWQFHHRDAAAACPAIVPGVPERTVTHLPIDGADRHEHATMIEAPVGQIVGEVREVVARADLDALR